MKHKKESIEEVLAKCRHFFYNGHVNVFIKFTINCKMGLISNLRQDTDGSRIIRRSVHDSL